MNADYPDSIVRGNSHLTARASIRRILQPKVDQNGRFSYRPAMPEPQTLPRMPGAILALYASFGVIVLIPVLIARYPPLVDYPNHLARCYILAHLARDPSLRVYYRDVMAAQPNLALDLIIPTFARFVSIWTAGRIFLGLTLAVLAGGCIALHRALHGRISAWPALGFLMLYNRLLLWGFLGYLFGLGIALLAAAGWFALRDRSWLVRLGYGLLAASVIYLLHLYALGIYGVLLGGFEIADILAVRRNPGERAGRFAVICLGFLPAACLFLFVSPTSGAVGRFVWGSLRRKLIEPFKLMLAYQPHIDILGLVLTVCLIAVLLKRRHIRIDRQAAPALAILGCLLLAMPNELFSSFGADRRIPIAFALVAIAATDWDGASTRLRGAVMLGATLTLTAQVASVSLVWARSQAIYRSVIAAESQLPRGVRLLATAPAGLAVPPLGHVDAYAVILRDAFVPSLFAAPADAGSSIAFTPAFEALRRRTPGVVIWPDTLRRLGGSTFASRAGPFRPRLTASYDAALIADPALLPSPARAPRDWPTIACGRRFVLLRVLHAHP